MVSRVPVAVVGSTVGTSVLRTGSGRVIATTSKIEPPSPVPPSVRALLLFLLGIEVGGNPRIVNGLQTLGLEAIVLTIGGCAGSVLFAWALWRYVSAKEAKAHHQEGGEA